MSEFLNNLKKAVDEGEFNSEAAKKINEIDKRADNFKSKDIEEMETKSQERIDRIEPEEISAKQIAEYQTEYEQKMAFIKRQDLANRQLATLIQIKDMVELSIDDMFQFIGELDEQLENQLKEDELFTDLAQMMEEIKNKYKHIRKSINEK